MSLAVVPLFSPQALSTLAMQECQRLRKIVDPYIENYEKGITPRDPIIERATVTFTRLALVIMTNDNLAIGNGDVDELARKLRLRMMRCYRLIRDHKELKFQFDAFERKCTRRGFASTRI